MTAVAAIDVGSNAVRLVMVELSAAGKLIHSEFHRYPVCLGADVFSQGRISEARLSELLSAFADIKLRLGQNGVERFRAVATAAVREAANRVEVVTRIRDQTGISLDVIDGREESRLSSAALTRAVGWAPDDALLVDLGGGTIELERANGRSAVSLPLGALRLLERFSALTRPLGTAELWELVDTVAAELGRMTRMHKAAPVMIGTGGNLDTLAQLIPAKDTVLPGIALNQLPELMDRLAAMSTAERITAYRLRPDRAELVVAAMVVVMALVRRFAVQSFVVPGTGLRESVLHQLTEPAEVLPQVRAVLNRLGYNAKPAEARARMARQLFEVTSAVHQLWQPALGPLLVAAYLYDIGRTIDPDAPSAHTSYIIQHAGGLDLEKRGRAIAAYAALVAAGHEAQVLYQSLSLDDRAVAERTAALLRLAVAITNANGTTIRRANTLLRPLTIECDLDDEAKGNVQDALDAAARALECELRVI